MATRMGKASTTISVIALSLGATFGMAAAAQASPVDTAATPLVTGQKCGTVISSPDGFANVRSGPGVGNKVLFKLNSGASVTVLKTKNGWSYIKDSKGRCGWVANWLIKDTCAKPTPPANKPDCSKPDKGCQKPPACTVLNRVLIPVQTGKKAPSEATQLANVRKAYPDAFLTTIDGTRYIQVGAFAVKSNATARVSAVWDKLCLKATIIPTTCP